MQTFRYPPFLASPWAKNHSVKDINSGPDPVAPYPPRSRYFLIGSILLEE